MVVAPYVGAWIETGIIVTICLISWVAPYVGAWIETSMGARCRRGASSHPTWVRGLKPYSLWYSKVPR